MRVVCVDKKGQMKRRKKVLLLGLFFLLCVNSVSTAATEWIYTVQAGDTLWGLSQEHLENAGNLRKLQDLNNISDPKNIPPGTQIRFPLAWLKIKRPPVRVLELTGEVSVISAQTGVATLLKPDSILLMGDEIQTGLNDNVLLEFLDNSRLLLQKNSRLIFETENTYNNKGVLDIRIRLPHGRIETIINPDKKKGTRFEIHTPAAITGVRGTNFRVSMEKNEKIGRTEVTQGKVAVSGTVGKTIVVPANFGTVVTVGQTPSPPSRLLPPPDLSQLPDHFTHLPLAFDWPTMDGAEIYRAQINSITVGGLLVDEEALLNPQLHSIKIPDGDYLLRVRAIDTNGLEGMNAEHKFTLIVPIEPPLLQVPSPNSTIDKQPLAFHWEAAKNSTSYYFQLSTSPDFSTPLVDIPYHSNTELNLEQTLEPGNYYWRVASRTPFDKQSTFSPVQQFNLGQPESLLAILALPLAWVAIFIPLLLWLLL
ncbi:hypothetical protein MNBD_GAMMA16-276 [hydrothermal vent metagenome]|uniref:LysM domain-containing protein n=1 Tax=hydrothermal vent metagenome TaxID=652676 RepID=A0A3B0ZJ62_9ZZZZ